MTQKKTEEAETVRDWCEHYFTSRGLLPTETNAVLAKVQKKEAQEESQPLAGIFPQLMGGYSDSVRSVLRALLNHHAVEWLKDNAPNHFALTVFEIEHRSATGEFVNPSGTTRPW